MIKILIKLQSNENADDIAMIWQNYSPGDLQQKSLKPILSVKKYGDHGE